MKSIGRGYAKSWYYHYKTETMVLSCILFIVALYAGLSTALQPHSTNTYDEHKESSTLSSDIESRIINLMERETTPDIVSRSESAEWVEVLDYGEIAFEEFYIPIDCCLTKDDVAGVWYVVVNVTGGYDAILDDWFLTLSDKDDNKWEFPAYEVTSLRRVFDDCCKVQYTFMFKWQYGGAEICIDANDFPLLRWNDKPVAPKDFEYAYLKPPGCDDLGKEYIFNLTTLWQGCEDLCQQFTISSIHSDIRGGGSLQI